MDNTELITVKLDRARTRLDVFIDLNTHFKCIMEADYHSQEYKDAADSLYSAILTAIDPLNY